MIFNLNSTTGNQNESVCFNSNFKSSNNVKDAFRQSGIATKEFKIDLIHSKNN